MQRDEAAKRAEDGVEWHPRLFRPVRGGPGGSEEGEEDLDWILNANIDGATPQKQTEQILAVTPILRGQKPTEKNPIPPPHTRSESYRSTHAPVKHQAPSLAAQSDLIDFGHNENQPTQQTIPADLHAAQTQNNGQQQKELETTLKSTSSPQPQGPLIDFHDDIKKNLPDPGLGLKRQDTETQSVDEFVDAEG